MTAGIQGQDKGEKNAKAVVQADESAGDDDLDQYGVWVKVGPQDVQEPEFTAGDEEEDLDSLEASGDSALTEEEEELLGSLEAESASEDELSFSETDTSFADLEESFDSGLEDIDLEGLSAEGVSPSGGQPELDEIGLDDLDLPDENVESLPEEEFLSSSIDLAEEVSAAPQSEPSESVDALGADDEIEEISLEEIAPAEDLPLVELDGELPDLDEFDELETPGQGLVDLEQVTPGLQEEEGVAELEVEELKDSEFGEELPDLDLPGTAGGSFEEGESQETARAESVEEAPLEELLTEDEEAIDKSEEELVKMQSQDDTQDTKTPEILAKIETELRLIKEELAELKVELSSLRGGEKIEEVAALEEEEEVEASAGASGFFGEDEDETIALTGDELDNILNTADITEETVESTETPDDQDLSIMEEESRLVDRDDVIPLELSEDEEPALQQEEAEAGEQEEAVEDALELDLEEVADSSDLAGLETLEAGDLEEELSLDEVSLPEEASIEVPEDAEAIDLMEIEDEDQPADVEEIESLDLAFEEEVPLEDIEDIATLEEAEEPSVEEEIALSESTSEEAEEPLELEVDEFADLDLDEQESVPSAMEEISALERTDIPEDLKTELRTVLKYMDHLLESLPEEKIQEFAQSEHFGVYKRLFEELGLEV